MSCAAPTERPGPSSIKGSDPAELSIFFSSLAPKVTANPINAGDISYECGFTNAGSLCIGLCRYEGDILIESEGASDKFLIFLPNYGESSMNVAGRDVLTVPGRGAIVDSNQHHNALLRGPTEHRVVGIDRTALGHWLSHMLERPVSGDIDFLPVIDLTSGTGMAIAHIAETLQSGLTANAPLRTAPLALASLSDALIQLVLETLPHRFSLELRRAASPVPRHVKRAIEFMRSNLSKPLTLDEIAAACGVSPRTLQQGFRQFKMTTPTAYLQYLRLEAVHRELLHAQRGQTVADIALGWGFGHLSRFAANYHTRFGQFPSETLRFSPERISDPVAQ